MSKYMGNIRIKRESSHSLNKGDKLSSAKLGDKKNFVLSDVSKEELDKRRIPVYPYLL